MEKQCPSCEKLVQYELEEPKFCSYCGSTFAETKSSSGEQSTLDAVTLPPRDTRPNSAFSVEADGSFGDVPVGTKIGAYEVQHQLGRGGMGVVYGALHQSTGQKVAIKLLNQSPDDSPKAAERFHRESQIAASISNPRSTFVYASGEHDGRRYIVMELMPGATLKDLIKQHGPIGISKAVDLILDVVTGIQSAHRRGIVHRDIKPSNCFIDNDNRIKVGDYGLSKSYDADVQLTKTGTFMGTLQFAAPEQVKGADVDERTDIYAIGATLYYLLTGNPPYDGDAAQVIAGIASDPVPDIRKKVDKIPSRLSRLIMQMLEKDPRNRPPNLAEVRARLLPFASRGATSADIGRRMAAFFVDLFIANTVVAASAIFICITIIMLAFQIDVNNTQNLTVSMAIVLTGFFSVVSYFSICEGLWGRGVGKLMFGMRVVGSDGGAPGIPRAVLRSMIIPGVMVLASFLLPVVFTGSHNGPNQTTPMQAFLGQVGATVVGWALAIAMLSTCRKSNGYRGVQGLLTKTHVVRIGSALSAPLLEDVPETLPSTCDQWTTCENESLQILGILGETTNGKVFLARDSNLDRIIWLVCDPVIAEQLSRCRVQISRPGRQRVLEYELPPGQVCLEAISGVPIRDMVKQIERLDWQTVRLLVESLADELIRAIEDETLPESLSLEQVWVDSEGHIKLSDVRIGDQDVSAIQRDSEAGRCIVLIQELLCLITEKLELPGHVDDFIGEIGERHEDISTLNWIRARLQQFETRASSWGWDDRLGTLATSLGTENSIYYFFAFSLALILHFGFGLGSIPIVVSSIVVMLAVAFAAGFWFHGGPVFHVCGVEIRNMNRKPVSRMICGLRNVVAWLPLHLFISSAVAIFATVVMPQSNFNETAVMGSSVFFLAIVISFAGFVIVLTCVQSILMPSRSLPDMILGTYLTRK